LWIFLNLHYFYDRIRYTKVYLAQARSQIYEFEKTNGRYPDSLAELKQYAKQHPGIDFKSFTECLSGSENNQREFNILNGEGGWYYNPNTGEVKVNLTKPVKHYMKFYFGNERNKIPAKW
jgi:hypothetical protein